MARKLSTPLTEEDLVFLRERYSGAYVDRMIELHGGPDATKEPEPDDEDDESGDEGSEQADGEPQAQPDADGAESGSEEPDEDLIGEEGELYDPLAHTTQEVRAHMKGASADEVARVKQVELAREDREPRTSITNFDPS